MTDDTFDEAAIFHEGLRLFNAQEWFDAHETWEDIWVMASGPRKLFYQGLIQCAVVMEHVRRGNPRGVRSVWKTAQSKFVDLPDQYMGLDIRKLLADELHAIEGILHLPDERFDPQLGRGQTLPYDPSDAPSIVLAFDPFAES
jgi:predicted metal-dependent hydrolase